MIDESELLELTNVSLPNVVVASKQQAMVLSQWLPPLGFELYGRSVATRRPTIWQPAKNSAIWFRHLFDAYCSAQFVNKCATTRDVAKLVASETAELLASSDCTSRLDDSLPPRSLAVWVCIRSQFLGTQDLSDVVDAVAHWSQHRVDGVRVASRIRLSMSDAACTAELANVLNTDTLNSPIVRDDLDALRPTACKKRALPKVCADDVVVLVRWVDDERTLRLQCCRVSECAGPQHVDDVTRPADAFLEALQATLAHIAASHKLPRIPAVLTAPVHSKVPPFSFLKLDCAVASEFNALRCAPPSSICNMSSTCNPSPSTEAFVGLQRPSPIASTSIAVRLSERKLGKSGLAAPTVFHGVLLADADALSSAHDFVRRHAHEDFGLPLPTSVHEREASMHVCAVNVNECFLRDAVTLYAPGGRAGAPIHSWSRPPHGSWYAHSCN